VEEASEFFGESAMLIGLGAGDQGQGCDQGEEGLFHWGPPGF
jgi:hypothetical protein